MMTSLAAQAGFAGLGERLVTGLLVSPVVGALLTFGFAFGGRLRFPPAIVAGVLLGLLVGLVVAAVPIEAGEVWPAMAAGAMIGALVAYLVCRLCPAKDRSAQPSHHPSRGTP